MSAIIHNKTTRFDTETLTIYVIPELRKVTEVAVKDWNKALAGRAEFIISPSVWIGRRDDITIDYGLVDRSNQPDRVAQAEWRKVPHGTYQWSILLDTRVKWAVTGWQRFWGLGQENALSAVLHDLGHTLGVPHSDVNHHVMHHSLGTTYISKEEAEHIREFWDARQKRDDS
jgi:predicted Zn-dependent protease